MHKIFLTLLIIVLSCSNIYASKLASNSNVNENDLIKKGTEYYYSDKNKDIEFLQDPEITECTRTYARCLEDLNEKGQSFSFPGGSVLYQAYVMFCAGRYMDCVEKSATQIIEA